VFGSQRLYQKPEEAKDEKKRPVTKAEAVAQEWQVKATLLQDKIADIEGDMDIPEGEMEPFQKLVVTKAKLAHSQALLELKDAMAKLEKARFEEERQELKGQVIQADRRAREAFTRGTQSKTLEVKEQKFELQQHRGVKRVTGVLGQLARGELASYVSVWRTQCNGHKSESMYELELLVARSKDQITALMAQAETLHKEQLFNQHQKATPTLTLTPTPMLTIP